MHTLPRDVVAGCTSGRHDELSDPAIGSVCDTGAMLTLALDVDGVILDPDRGGEGHWTNALEGRFDISRPQLRAEFFTQDWDDVINGRLMIEVAMGDALARIGSDAGVEEVLECWFESDFVVRPTAIDLAKRVTRQGGRVVLATNQEHRRAAFLGDRLGAMFPIDDVIYSAELGHQKHEPEFFRLATRRLDSDPGDILFVDDVLHNVEQAAGAGWRAVHAPPGVAWEPVVADRLGLE